MSKQIDKFMIFTTLLILTATPSLANDLQSTYIDSYEYESMTVTSQKAYIAGVLDGFYFVARKSNSPEYLSGMLKKCSDSSSVHKIHNNLESALENNYQEDMALTISNVLIDDCFN